MGKQKSIDAAGNSTIALGNAMNIEKRVRELTLHEIVDVGWSEIWRRFADEIKREIVAHVYELSDRNVSKTARHLSMSRTTVRSYLKESK
jgi:ActR/RegA family two-component response regulator